MYYFYKNSPWWVHGLWFLIIAFSISLCAYLSQMIWRKFADNPTFTVVESTHYSIDDIPFPAVSVCDPDMVYGPNAYNITNILKLRGYDKEKINSFYESITKIRNPDYVPKDYLKKMHSTLDDLGYSYETIANQVKKPCELLISDCAWRSKPVECSRMFREVFTIVGHCCQFDIDYFSKNAEKGTNFRTGIEATEGLDISVSNQKILPNGTITDSNVFLFVFDKENYLTLLDSSITLTSSAYFDILIDVWTIDSSRDVKALSLKNRKCFLPTDTISNADSHQGCVMMHILKKVVDYCRCLPFNYLAKDLEVEDLPACTWEKLICVYQMIDQVQSSIRDEQDCYQKCDHAQYETETEYVKLNRPEKSQNNSCRVAVHFAVNTCIKYRREVLYTWDQMLANLGGIFGLCLGGSIISLIELLWFILEVLFTGLGVIQKRKVIPSDKREDKMVFTLTKNVLYPKKFKKGKPRYPYLN